MTPASRSDYLIVIQPGEGGGYRAHAPDMPGCRVSAATVERCETLMRDAIHGYVQELEKYGNPVPEPTIVGATFVTLARAGG